VRESESEKENVLSPLSPQTLPHGQRRQQPVHGQGEGRESRGDSCPKKKTRLALTRGSPREALGCARRVAGTAGASLRYTRRQEGRLKGPPPGQGAPGVCQAGPSRGSGAQEVCRDRGGARVAHPEPEPPGAPWARPCRGCARKLLRKLRRNPSWKPPRKLPAKASKKLPRKLPM